MTHNHNHHHHGGFALANSKGEITHSGLETHHHIVENHGKQSSTDQHHAVWSMGLDTFQVPMSLHKQNRDKLIQYFKDNLAAFDSNLSLDSVALLQGGAQQHQYDTDRELVFRQESYFMYLFGVTEPDCFAAIDLSSSESILFVPKLPEVYAVWEGVIHPLEYFKAKYEVSTVKYTEDLNQYFVDRKPTAIHTLLGINSDSKAKSVPATFEGIERFNVVTSFLHTAITECRVIKSSIEIEIMRYVNKVSSEAHKKVMKACRPGMMEYQLESLFLHEIYTEGGCRFCAYTCICGTGKSGATLHYGQNCKLIRDGDMVLLDMGGEYNGYVADISRSYPANGKFTQDQIDIYESVLAAQNAVMDKIKPGVSWPELHRLSERVILEQLKSRGFLQGNVDDMVKCHLASVFMPHGLGHLMGMDVHDVGGYPNGTERSSEPGLNRLRTNRVLKSGMVLTVEPGIYFVDALLNAALVDPVQSAFLVKEKIARFRNFGGVRLEDDIVVTETGMENLTTVTRDIKEIEAIMASGR